MEYPEHEKLSEIADKSRAVGEFVDWLREERGITLCEPGQEVDTFRTAMRTVQAMLDHTHSPQATRIKAVAAVADDEPMLRDAYVQVRTPITRLLAEYFEIDERKLEQEKRAMLSQIRRASA